MGNLYHFKITWGIFFILGFSLLQNLQSISFYFMGKTLSGFEKNLGKGVAHQIELSHFFKEKNYLFGLQAGYFYATQKFAPLINFSWHGEKNGQSFKISIATITKTYRHGFLSANGTYSEFEEKPLLPYLSWGAEFLYQNHLFYSYSSYQQKLFLPKDLSMEKKQPKQFFSLLGITLYKNIFDLYIGYLFDIQNSREENRQKKNHSPILGFDIGNKNNTKTWILSLQYHRWKDFHSFIKINFNNYSFLFGYYQKKSFDSFSYGFFNEPTHSFYFKTRFFYFKSSGKFNKNNQKINLQVQIPLKKIQQDFSLYGSYSSKSSSITGFLLHPPLEKTSFFFGIYYLPPQNGIEGILGIGKKKIFLLSYSFLKLWQEVYAPLNPLLYKNSDIEQFDTRSYVNQSTQAITFSIEKYMYHNSKKSKLLFLIQFQFSFWDKTNQTVFSQGIVSQIRYIYNF